MECNNCHYKDERDDEWFEEESRKFHEKGVDGLSNEGVLNLTETILKEIKIQSEGHHQLFSDYEDIRLELKRVKLEKENYEKLYKQSLSGNNNLNENYDERTKNDLKKYKNKVYELEDDIEQFKDYKKENEHLHNMLYQIYNLLFDTFRLDKNIKIDKKYNFIKEEDFKPNIFCNPEIGNYVKLMIKSMKESTTGQELRETIAFANMLVGSYFYLTN